MKVQEWLRNNGGNLELLEQQLGISSTVHEDGRVILNYSQIDSPKNNEIVRECRGLVLDSKNDWALVARAFPRFFNVGEFPDEFKQFKWNNSVGYHKEDGSLLLVYRWNDKVYINTRGSFGGGEVNYSGITWRELALQALPLRFFEHMWPYTTYVFELCSPHNKIVRSYKWPQAFLLTMYNTDMNYEYSSEAVDYEAEVHGLLRPQIICFESLEKVEEYIRWLADNDPTFEGIVLRDSADQRWKVKSPEYLALHRMANNGDPCHPKNLLPFILSGELDELYAYFPEVKPYVDQMQKKIDLEWKEVDNYWYVWWDEPSQKKFALGVKDSKHSGILFSARKHEVEPRELFYNLEYLTKMFKGFKYED
jgi:hypothetical protein